MLTSRPLCRTYGDPTHSGRARITCACGATLVKQPYMTGVEWEGLVSGFCRIHGEPRNVEKGAAMLTKADMKVGGKYNWKNQPERLVYIRHKHYSGDRRTWHQFAKVDAPSVVWCEVLDEDLHMLEKTGGGDHAS